MPSQRKEHLKFLFTTSSQSDLLLISNSKIWLVHSAIVSVSPLLATLINTPLPNPNLPQPSTSNGFEDYGFRPPTTTPALPTEIDLSNHHPEIIDAIVKYIYFSTYPSSQFGPAIGLDTHTPNDLLQEEHPVLWESRVWLAGRTFGLRSLCRKAKSNCQVAFGNLGDEEAVKVGMSLRMAKLLMMEGSGREVLLFIRDVIEGGMVEEERDGWSF